MSEQASSLARLLEALHHELEQGPSVDEQTGTLLRTVLADIEQVMDDRATPPAGHHDSLADRLRETTWHLEETHPRLTTAIGQLIDALGRTIT